MGGGAFLTVQPQPAGGGFHHRFPQGLAGVEFLVAYFHSQRARLDIDMHHITVAEQRKVPSFVGLRADVADDRPL